MIEKGEFNSPLREPLNELMASCLESGLKRLSSFWMSGLFVETRCFASFPRQVPMLYFPKLNVLNHGFCLVLWLFYWAGVFFFHNLLFLN